MCEKLFNPLGEEEREKLERRILEALNNCPGHPLPPDESFPGAGIYALYYFGSFDLYSRLAERNARGQYNVPIYAGKANLKGVRTARGSTTRQTPLYNRLREHARSINEAVNLNVDDFGCKYLVLEQTWVSLGEQILIRQFSPIWNTVVEGFGIHTPGRGRAGQQRSQWDTLHPGREWVEKLKLPPNAMGEEEIRRRVHEHLNHLT
ncbi:MAG: Eco29kI family restriction endonuclease [Candidatus Bipolaricaulia bacterium]